MENISITTYRGLSLVSGSISIRQMFEFIRGDVYRDRIRRLREAMDAGDTVKADHMKKQLPYCTITATYAKERLAYSLDKYQDIITLDCDDMPAEKIPEFRQLVNDCPDTLGSFVSPRMHGLKIFVYLTGNEAEALRTELNALGTVDFTPLERYHHRMYALASSQYEKLLNTKVDTSGSDPGRGFFVSHDPDAFLSPERLENVKPLTVKVTLPTEEECKNKKRKNPGKRSPLLPVQENASPIDLQVQLDFRKALEYTKRKERLEIGNRDNFFYCLGNQCYHRPYHGRGVRQSGTQPFRRPTRFRPRTALAQCLPIYLKDRSGGRKRERTENLPDYQVYGRTLRNQKKRSERTNRIPEDNARPARNRVAAFQRSSYKGY